MSLITEIHSSSTSGAWTRGQVSITNCKYHWSKSILTHYQNQFIIISISIVFSNNSDFSDNSDDQQQYSGNLTILVSPRALPQLVSRVYAIHLQDVLKTGHRITFKEPPYPKEPLKVGEIELESWQIPDLLEDGSKGHYGALYPSTGVIGWFIPKGLIGNGWLHICFTSAKYLINIYLLSRDLPKHLPYSMFQGNISEEILEQFHVDEETEQTLQEFAE